eukprot:jgi/Tetstr1/450664/TSEL_037700.t1
MSISAADVKQLREMTGVGMMDCKKALTETNGDIEAAIDWLRSKGLAKAAKKADRVAAEGLVGIATDGNRAAIVEINSETDFVARNEQFQGIVRNAAKLALDVNGDVDALAAAPFPGTGRTVSQELTEAIAKIGENMTLRRAAVMEVAEGAIGSYVHSTISEGLGRIGVLVGLESAGDKAKLTALGRQIAMHRTGQASGKPDNIVEKMVEGRIRKYYEEVTLLAQTFVIDGENTVEQAVKNAEADVGAPIKVAGYVLFALGEGIEKQESDFAAEIVDLARAGMQVAIVIGGGNIFRGMAVAAKGGDRVIGDHMGMLGTVINSLALGDAIRRAGGRSHVFSSVSMPSICDTFTQRAAIAALEGGATVICAGGTGNPFFTTDTAAALKAIELRCDVLLKGTKVDGVYSADPEKDPSATRFDAISHEEAIAQDLRVMDTAAFALARDNGLPIIVYALSDKEGLVGVLDGRTPSTRVG